jgi:hypothetical protein
MKRPYYEAHRFSTQMISRALVIKVSKASLGRK